MHRFLAILCMAALLGTVALPSYLLTSSLNFSSIAAAVSENLQDKAGFGEEGQAEQTYPSVDQVQDG